MKKIWTPEEDATLKRWLRENPDADLDNSADKIKQLGKNLNHKKFDKIIEKLKEFKTQPKTKKVVIRNLPVKKEKAKKEPKPKIKKAKKKDIDLEVNKSNEESKKEDFENRSQTLINEENKNDRPPTQKYQLPHLKNLNLNTSISSKVQIKQEVNIPISAKQIGKTR